MRKLLLLSVALVLGLVFLNSANAASLADIEFPISELGDCANKEACREYCENDENREVCLDFAAKKGLMDKDEIEKAKRIPKTGPGGCDSPRACQEYCKDPNNQETCIKFAEDNGFISAAEAERAKRFKDQSGPGGCRGEACKDYCDKKENRKACLEFAKKNNLISEKEAAVAEDVIERGGPGGCMSDEECRAYCEDQSHLEECVTFGEKHGFISKEDAAKIRKLGAGTGPGGCKRDECKKYCEDPSHQEECIKFAVEKGLMTKEEAERARKFASAAGPGGCVGQECRSYCEKPENAESCLKFAEENNLIPREQLEHARKFLRVAEQGGPGGCKGQACREYCESEDHREECFKFAEERGLLSAEERQQIEVGRKLDEKLKEAGGPGGCKSDEECRTYCSEAEHTEECVAFAATHGGLPEEAARKMLKEFTRQKARHGGDFESVRRFEEETKKRFEEFREIERRFRPGDGQEMRSFQGPGGCMSEEECRKYCSEHLEECIKMRPPEMPFQRPQDMHREDMNLPGNFQRPDFEKPGFPGQNQFPGQNHPRCMILEGCPGVNGDQERRRLEDELRRLNHQMQNTQNQGDAGPGGCMDEIACAKFCDANPAECEAFERRFEGNGFEG